MCYVYNTLIIRNIIMITIYKTIYNGNIFVYSMLYLQCKAQIAIILKI